MARSKPKAEPPIIDAEKPVRRNWQGLLISLIAATLVGGMIAVYIFFEQPIQQHLAFALSSFNADYETVDQRVIAPENSVPKDTERQATAKEIDPSTKRFKDDAPTHGGNPPTVSAQATSGELAEFDSSLTLNEAALGQAKAIQPSTEKPFEQASLDQVPQRSALDVAMVLRAGGPLEPVWAELELQVATSTLDVLFPVRSTIIPGRDLLMIDAYKWWQSQSERAGKIASGMPVPIDNIINGLVTKKLGRSSAQEAFYQAVNAGDINGALAVLSSLSQIDRDALASWRAQAEVYLALEDAQAQWRMGD